MLVSFTDSKKVNLAPYLLFGSISVLFGLTIYLLLPYSLIMMDFSLVLQVFFVILMGMLFGITLLVSQLQSLLEVLIIHLLLFWEKPSMKSLVKNNLIAHRHRNKLTAMIYSLTLGSIIFLLVAATL